jgi:hypothetical protein
MNVWHPDHPYYDDWGNHPELDHLVVEHPPRIDWAGIVIFLWIILGSIT